MHDSGRRAKVLMALPLMLLWGAMLALGGPESLPDRVILDAFAHPAWTDAARAVTGFGDWFVLLGVALAGAVFLVFRRPPRSASVLVGAVLAGRILVELQKTGFDRARPDVSGHQVAVHSMAFPSGHSANSMIALLALALLVPPAGQARTGAVAAALVLAFLIGLSRLILAVHWPSDVIGGWAFGAAFVLLLVGLFGAPPSPAGTPR